MKRILIVMSGLVLASQISFGAGGLREPVLAARPAALRADPAAAPAAPQANKPQWKSRAEYDAFAAIFKATSPDAKITAANAFLAKFPTSDFKVRAEYFKLRAYQQLNQSSEATATAHQILSANPSDAGVKLEALNQVSYVFPFVYKPTSPDAATESTQMESEAKQGLQLLQQIQKPANVPQQAFDKAVKTFRTDFNRALGFAALSQKDYPTAITYLNAAAEDNPEDPYTYSFLGQAYISSNPPDYNNGLWYLARSLELAKSGGTAASEVQALQKFYSQSYEYRHGSNAGEQALIAQAGAAANPPAGFNVAPPPKHKKTGNPNVDAFYGIEDSLSVGGDAAQAAWTGYQGQSLGIVAFVESVTKGNDADYSVRADVLPQDRGVAGDYNLVLQTNQADAKYLTLGTPIRFDGTLSTYSMTPAFTLTLSNVKIDPASLNEAKEKAELAKQKAAAAHHRPGQ